MKLILFCTLHSSATRFRYTLMYKYFTFAWWKFVYSPTQTLNLDWYKACIIITIEKIRSVWTEQQQRSEVKRKPELQFSFLVLFCSRCGNIFSRRENPKERRLHHVVSKREISLALCNQSRSFLSTQAKYLTTMFAEWSRATAKAAERKKWHSRWIANICAKIKIVMKHKIRSGWFFIMNFHQRDLQCNE